MIPKKIHYCWFGRGPMPELALKCIESWHRLMPDYEYKLWNEDNFDVHCNPYVEEAYAARKFAFVTDYVRLHALESEGGVYMDTDVEALKPYDDLLHLDGFIGYEGSKYQPIGTGTIASIPHGPWVREQLAAYDGIHFVQSDGSYDLMTNPFRITSVMRDNGFVPDGKEQEYKGMHIFPVDYFCPRQTTGEVLMTENTYCDHQFMSSWKSQDKSLKSILLSLVGNQWRIRLIKLKRRIENTCKR